MIQADSGEAESSEKFTTRSQWLPIGSAPKDGTWILGWSVKDSCPSRISWSRNHNNQLAWRTSFCAFVPGYITHWMPLPLAPDSSLNFSDESESDPVSLNHD